MGFVCWVLRFGWFLNWWFYVGIMIVVIHGNWVWLRFVWGFTCEFVDSVWILYCRICTIGIDGRKFGLFYINFSIGFDSFHFDWKLCSWWRIWLVWVWLVPWWVWGSLEFDVNLFEDYGEFLIFFFYDGFVFLSLVSCLWLIINVKLNSVYVDFKTTFNFLLIVIVCQLSTVDDNDGLKL